MVAPLLSSGDPTSPPPAARRATAGTAARSGPATEVVLPGALGDDVDPQADSRFVPDAPDPSLAMTRHVRAAFVALDERPAHVIVAAAVANNVARCRKRDRIVCFYFRRTRRENAREEKRAKVAVSFPVRAAHERNGR